MKVLEIAIGIFIGLVTSTEPTSTTTQIITVTDSTITTKLDTPYVFASISIKLKGLNSQ